MFFFFKQKTAYELRIIDWSSDVCSSDLKTDNCLYSQDFFHAPTSAEGVWQRIRLPPLPPFVILGLDPSIPGDCSVACPWPPGLYSKPEGDNGRAGSGRASSLATIDPMRYWVGVFLLPVQGIVSAEAGLCV